MCDLSQGFILCICNKVDEAKSHWKLFRFGDEQTIVIGEVDVEFYEQLMKYNWVKEELNDRNCFDFEYTPQHGDRLIFILKKDEDEFTLCFDYEDLGYLAGWRSIDLYANDDAEAIHVGYVPKG